MERRFEFSFRNETGEINWLKVVAAGIGGSIVVVVMIVLVWWTQVWMGSGLVINNLGQYASQMGQNSRNTLFQELYLTAQNNLPEGERPPRRGAMIREGTYTETFDEEFQIYSSKFIVDIESIKQSYRISADWPKDPDDPIFGTLYTVASCLPEKDMIYPDFGCKNMDWVEEAVTSAGYYLPYTETVPGSGETAFRIWQDDADLEWIVVSYQACGNGELAEKYKGQAKAWLDETEIDLEKYQIEYVDTCDGEF